MALHLEKDRCGLIKNAKNSISLHFTLFIYINGWIIGNQQNLISLDALIWVKSIFAVLSKLWKPKSSWGCTAPLPFPCCKMDTAHSKGLPLLFGSSKFLTLARANIKSRTSWTNGPDIRGCVDRKTVVATGSSPPCKLCHSIKCWNPLRKADRWVGRPGVIIHGAESWRMTANFRKAEGSWSKLSRTDNNETWVCLMYGVVLCLAM